MRKSYKSKLLVFLILLSSLVGCTQKKVEYDLPELNYLNHFYLAENDLGKKIYILGTIHFTKNDVNELPKEILEGFDNSDEIYIESKIDLDAAKKYENKLYENCISELKNEVALKYWNEIKKNYNSIDERYNKFNAMSIQSFATQEIINELGLKAVNTMDMYICDKAEKSGKKIIEFEGIEKQYNIIADMSKKCPSVILKQIADKDSYLKETKEMWEDFCEGKPIKDSSTVSTDNEISSELSDEIMVYEELLLSTRNNNINDKIYESKSEKKFVAVGAAHIYGDNGIINFLKNKGYKILSYK